VTTIRSRIRKAVEKVTRLHIYKVLPQGIDFFHDINTLLPQSIPKIIFDVGANVGQSSKEYVDHYPRAQIYSFEPVKSVYGKLQQNMSRYENVFTYQLAFSSIRGHARITCDAFSSKLNAIISSDTSETEISSEIVDLDTIDEFCRTENIPQIDFLKVDTEGHDLDVLKGAGSMLRNQNINIVQVEAGMNPKNNKFVTCGKFSSYFEGMGYYLFGVYEQINEYYTGEPNLRRSNLVYISDSVIIQNRLSHSAIEEFTS